MPLESVLLATTSQRYYASNDDQDFWDRLRDSLQQHKMVHMFVKKQVYFPRSSHRWLAQRIAVAHFAPCTANPQLLYLDTACIGSKPTVGTRNTALCPQPRIPGHACSKVASNTSSGLERDVLLVAQPCGLPHTSFSSPIKTFIYLHATHTYLSVSNAHILAVDIARRCCCLARSQ